MSEQQTPGIASRLRTALLPELIFVAVLPYLVYRLASAQLPGTFALLLAGITPLLRILIGLVRQHRLNLLGTLSLLAIAVNIIIGLAFNNPRLLLIGGSFVTGIYGIIMLASVLLRRPVILTIVENAVANDAAQQERVQKRWRNYGRARYLSFFTFITALWGSGLLLECIVRISLTFTLPVEQFLVISPIVRYAILGMFALVTFLFARIRYNRRMWESQQEHL